MEEKEIRNISIRYRDKQVNINIQLGHNVTIKIGDWYIEGEVKKE
jgi:hypothetical protein